MKKLFAVVLLFGRAMAQPASQPFGDGVHDDYAALQRSIDNAISSGQSEIFLTGTYKISHPLIIARRNGKSYGQVSLNLRGRSFAKNANNCTRIIYTSTQGFAIGIQSGKGCVIEDISVEGQFTFVNKLSPVAIYTLPFAKWDDGSCGQNRTSPYAGIVVDPFSDPSSYDGIQYKKYPGLDSFYLPGMSRAGSTGVRIKGCSIKNFVVGVMITPSYQQNGEMIDVDDCNLSFNKVSYAFSQAQSKANSVEKLMVWGGVHTVFDGVSFGFLRSDGSIAPLIDLVNIAGAVHQLLNCHAGSFPVSVKRVYAESLFKIGYCDGLAGSLFEDFQVDFANSNPGVPTPDFYFFGRNIIWINCMLRLYGDNPHKARILLCNTNSKFVGGSMNYPPVVTNLSGNSTFEKPIFDYVSMYYKGGIYNGGKQDTTFPIRYYTPSIKVNDDFSGSFQCQNGDEKRIAVGDMILTQHPFLDQFPGLTSYSYPVGIVAAISGSTIFLQNIAVGISNGMTIPIS